MELSLQISQRSIPFLQPAPSAVVVVALEINAEDERHEWLVNVTTGWYLAAAVGPTIAAKSNSFFVATGANTSCLAVGSRNGVSSSNFPLSTMADSHREPTTSTVSGGASSSTGTGHGHAGVIAGCIVAGVVALITIVLLCLYFCSTLGQGEGRASLGRRRSAKWFGLPPSDEASRTPSLSYTTEKAFLDSNETQDAVLPRLEPNRRQSRAYAIDTSAVLPPQEGTSTTEKAFLDSVDTQDAVLPRLQPNRRASPVYAIETSTVLPLQERTQADAPARPTVNPATTRGDSPTLPPNPHVKRKPVSALLPSTLGADAGSPHESAESTKGYDSSLHSAVPSTATSQMYHIRDSAFSVRTRSYTENEDARASSVVDPHMFGAMKPMQRVVPAVPPLPIGFVRKA
ncbi:hypothetical protein BD414DRAFT_223340 [Trametes punicea]|nr:hypothetical protein BD414DRAFT_223340 [Trametes punicea]